MKDPDEKNELFGFHDAVLMSVLGAAKLSVPVNSSNVSISVFPGSFRLSNQMTWMPPWLSTETHGKNWSFGAPAPTVESGCDTNCMSLQVVPWSVENAPEISAPDEPALMLFCTTYTSAPSCGSKSMEGDSGIRAFLFGSRSLRLGLSFHCPGLLIFRCGPKDAPPFVLRLKSRARSNDELQSSDA